MGASPTQLPPSSDGAPQTRCLCPQLCECGGPDPFPHFWEGVVNTEVFFISISLFPYSFIVSVFLYSSLFSSMPFKPPIVLCFSSISTHLVFNLEMFYLVRF